MPAITLILPDEWVPWIENYRVSSGIRSRHALILMAIESFVKIPRPEVKEVPKESDSWPIRDVMRACPECSPSLFNGRPIYEPKHCGGGYRQTIPNPVTKVREKWICTCEVCVGKAVEEIHERSDEEAPKVPDAKITKRSLAALVEEIVDGSNHACIGDIKASLDSAGFQWPPATHAWNTVAVTGDRMADIESALRRMGWQQGPDEYRDIDGAPMAMKTFDRSVTV